jgi:hypothetical protein
MKEKVKISLEQALASNSVMNFVEAASCYCLLIETKQSDSPKEFLEILNGQLLTLYTMGLNLPDVFIKSNKDFDTNVPEAKMRAVVKSIGDRIPFSYYWTVLNPLDESNLPETGTGDLADDLADIYLDLKRALMQFDSEGPEAKENAIWQFKFDFNNHWQEHCIGALQIIFQYLFDNR